MRPPASLALATAVLAVIFALAAGAATLEVPSEYPTIAAALGAAAAGDTVRVAAGIYQEHDLVLSSGVCLVGATGDPANVTIDAQRAGRCIYGAGLDAATRIEAVTLANGLSTAGAGPVRDWGGALFVDQGALTLKKCLFLANESAIGGGAYINATGAPLIEDCTFLDNSAEEDAGILLTGICDPVVRNCTFRGGTWTVFGGGLGWAGAIGTLTVEDCLFEDNAVLETGGALELIGHPGSPDLHPGCATILRRCTVTGNSARVTGGGIFINMEQTVTIEDCVIRGNSAGEGGGLMIQQSAVVMVEGSTILDNAAPTGADGSVWGGTTVTLRCCTIDLSAWHHDEPVIVDDEGCSVGVRDRTWGGLKALHR